MRMMFALSVALLACDGACDSDPRRQFTVEFRGDEIPGQAELTIRQEVPAYPERGDTTELNVAGYPYGDDPMAVITLRVYGDVNHAPLLLDGGSFGGDIGRHSGVISYIFENDDSRTFWGRHNGNYQVDFEPKGHIRGRFASTLTTESDPPLPERDVDVRFVGPLDLKCMIHAPGTEAEIRHDPTFSSDFCAPFAAFADPK